MSFPTTAPRNALAEWIVEENPSVLYEDIEGLPATILTAMYPDTEPGGHTWLMVKHLCLDIVEGSPPEKVLLPFIEFWREQIWCMESSDNYFPDYPDGLEYHEAKLLAGRRERYWQKGYPTAEEAELASAIPSHLPRGLIAQSVESFLRVGGMYSFEQIVRDSDVGIVQAGLKVSAVLLLTANENGLGTRTWEQHENALAPLVQLMSEVPALSSTYLELPFTRNSSSPGQVN